MWCCTPDYLQLTRVIATCHPSGAINSNLWRACIRAIRAWTPPQIWIRNPFALSPFWVHEPVGSNTEHESDVDCKYSNWQAHALLKWTMMVHTCSAEVQGQDRSEVRIVVRSMLLSQRIAWKWLRRKFLVIITSISTISSVNSLPFQNVDGRENIHKHDHRTWWHEIREILDIERQPFEAIPRRESLALTCRTTFLWRHVLLYLPFMVIAK